MPERPDLDFLFAVMVAVGSPILVGILWLYDGFSQVADCVKWAWRKVRGK